jgi:hypothetical protein
MKIYLLIFSIILISTAANAQDLKTEKIMEIGIPLNPPVVVGSRAIYSWNEGQVTGMIHGKLLPLGAEFGKMLDNNTYQIDVRAVIETDDKESIYVTYSGYIFTDTETFNLINTGHGAEIDPSKYYFRSNPIFETKSTKYSWLNHTISVGVGTCTKNGVMYKVYAVK